MGAHSLPVDFAGSNPNWQEIEELLDQLAELARSSGDACDFYRQLLDRIVPAIGASGGAVWTAQRPTELLLEYQIDLAGSQVPLEPSALACHRRLVEDVLHSGQPRTAPPRSGESTSDAATNPSDCWLVCYPFRAGPEASGAIELVQRHAMSPATVRGYLRLLAAAVELTEDFHRHRELGELRQRQQTWRDFERFAEQVHRSLDLNQTAFLIANEGRRILDCDRVSILLRRGKQCRTAAISGVDALDRRAQVVRALERLTARAVAAGELVWYCDGAADMPDEIERPLQAYLDESHARTVAIVPLCEPQSASPQRPARVIGALVAEQLQASPSDARLRERAGAVAPHAATALNNALVHSRLPLSTLGRMLSRLSWLAEARQLPKTALALAAVAASVAALTFIPADFDIESRGELQPQLRRDVFASDDGVVSELLVDHARAVHTGDPLVVLRKPELDLEFRRFAGEIQTAEKKLAAVRAERLSNVPVEPDSRRNVHQLTSDEEELKELLKGLLAQREVLQQQRADLVVRSPLDGQALTWNLEELLAARPVQRGQSLLSVADLAGPWVVELHVPDHRAGHVLSAREELRTDLAVSFALAADPGKVYQGRIEDVALATHLDEADGATVLVTVAFDRDEVEGLRPGATVLARIDCGRRSLGYVWLHDLFEAVQSHWWW